MKREVFPSKTSVTRVGNGEQIYTNHIVISPPEKNLFTHANEKKISTRLKKSGIQMGEGVRFFNVPYIRYTSRSDKFIYKDDFHGRIILGNNVMLQSRTNYPLPNSFVRFDIVKTGMQKIGCIKIGDNVILPGTCIISYLSVEIGSNVLIGPNVIIMDSSGHDLASRGMPDEIERIKAEPVVIEDSVWLGYGVVILKGVKIGKNSVVGINSVVHESVPDNTLVAGNPAKIVKKLN